MDCPYEIDAVEFVRADRVTDRDALLDVPGVGYGSVVDYHRDEDASIVYLTVVPMISAVAEGPAQVVVCDGADMRMVVARAVPDDDEIEDALDELFGDGSDLPDYEDIVARWPGCEDF